uniref:(northern house mosquito) hypothetical protein n=2 Tax=Culex pipiens TaxID=7175 RepID=A0A8D8DZS6_CULPI
MLPLPAGPAWARAPSPAADLPVRLCASGREPLPAGPCPFRESAVAGYAPVAVAAESGAMAGRGDPYRRGEPSAAVPCGADPSAVDSSGGGSYRGGQVAAAMHHGRVLAAAAADRTTSGNGNDDGGVRPSSNRNRTPRSSCSRTGSGSSSVAAMVAASGVLSVAATETFDRVRGQVAVAIPLGVPRGICDGIPAVTADALASGEAVSAPEVAMAMVDGASVAERAKQGRVVYAVVRDCADGASLGNGIGYGCDVLVLDLHRRRCHICREVAVGGRHRNRSCWRPLRCTSS